MHGNCSGRTQGRAKVTSGPQRLVRVWKVPRFLPLVLGFSLPSAYPGNSRIDRIRSILRYRISGRELRPARVTGGET